MEMSPPEPLGLSVPLSIILQMNIQKTVSYLLSLLLANKYSGLGIRVGREGGHELIQHIPLSFH